MTLARIEKRCSAALFLLLLLAVSVGLDSQAGAHSGGRVYPIVELTDEMLEQIQLDDGTVDEWFELIGEPTMTLLDFSDPQQLPTRHLIPPTSTSASGWPGTTTRIVST